MHTAKSHVIVIIPCHIHPMKYILENVFCGHIFAPIIPVINKRVPVRKNTIISPEKGLNNGKS